MLSAVIMSMERCTAMYRLYLLQANDVSQHGDDGSGCSG